jgi:hypothetical protein
MKETHSFNNALTGFQNPWPVSDARFGMKFDCKTCKLFYYFQ